MNGFAKRAGFVTAAIALGALACWGEPEYAFRARMAELHPNRLAADAAPVAADEIVVDGSWKIVYEEDDAVLKHGADDLRDFFTHGMSFDPGRTAVGKSGPKTVSYAVDPTLEKLQAKVEVTEDRIRITGVTAREALQGGIRLEEMMSVRGRPAVKRGTKTFTRMFSPRMTHSGWAVEKFPDVYMDQLAHAGMDAILVFIADPPDVSRVGKEDMNELVERARVHGLDVYAYCWFPVKAAKHSPTDPAAEQWYEETYGAIVKNAPGVKGIVCVGESVGFPTKDGTTAGYWWGRREERVKDKPLCGFYPTMEWVPWLEKVTRATRKFRPDLDVMFWTYNWYSRPAEVRLPLLEKIPTNITMLVTLAMGDTPEKKCGVDTWMWDYSITRPGPGTVFKSEAEIAKRRGIRLYSMANCGGRTWDIGCAPCHPVPDRWIERFRNIRDAQDRYGLSGLMESHHYGFQPNLISEIAKQAFTRETDAAGLDEALAGFAARDFGRANVKAVLAAWRDWSEAFRWHSAHHCDLAGPYRTGPVYPFVLPGGKRPLPLEPKYEYYEGKRYGDGWKYLEPEYEMPADLLPAYIEMSRREVASFERGCARLRAVLPQVPEEKRPAAERQLANGEFHLATAQTMLNAREYRLTGLTYVAKETPAAAREQARQKLLKILDAERENVRRTIPVTETDSALGWEPTMLYVCGARALAWKLRQIDDAEAELRCAAGERVKEPVVRVTLPDEPTPAESYAAEELLTWTAKLPRTKPLTVILKRDAAFGDDGFRLTSKDGTVTVSGGARGLLYGVYELLETYGGIGWFSSTTTVVPEDGALAVPDGLDRTERPAFDLREPYWYDVMQSPDFAARLRVNARQCGERHGGCNHLFDTVLGNAHTFYKLVPPARYFKDHPEYFSEVNGKRTCEKAQLCLSNPDVLKIVVSNVLERIRLNPSAECFGVSQNDCAGFCTCATCAAVDAEEKSPAGSVIRFVNAVADEVGKVHPDKIIETLAYQYSRKPPKHVRVRKNVMPCLCSIECGFDTPIAKGATELNRKFAEDLRGWAAQTEQLYLWDYTTDYTFFLYPFANVRSLQDNVRFFRDGKVRFLFEQGNHLGRSADFAELKAWLLAKWMWNPELPMEPLLKRFFTGYYGAAAPSVRRYFDELHALPRDPRVQLSIYEQPYQPWMTDAFLERAAGFWDEAERLVKVDPARLKNVRYGRLSVDATRLLRHRDAKRRWNEWRALAASVMARIDGEHVRISEPGENETEHRALFRRIAGASFEEVETGAPISVSDRRRVSVGLEKFFYAAGEPLTLRVRARGGDVRATVCDWGLDATQRAAGTVSGARLAEADGAWTDVFTWTPGAEGGILTVEAVGPTAELDAYQLVPAVPKTPLRVALTFDDSLKDHLLIAAPLLEQHGWRGVFNIVTDWVGKDKRFLTWDDVRELVRRGHEVTTHTTSHPHLVTWLDEGRTNDVCREIAASRDLIAAKTGFAPRYMCAPFVQQNETTARLCREAGLKQMSVRRYGFGSNNQDSVEEAVHELVRQGVTRIDFLHHGVSAADHGGWSPFRDRASFARHLDRLAALEKEGLVIVTDYDGCRSACALRAPVWPRHGVLALSFDDRNLVNWKDALPLFAKYDATATFCLTGPIANDGLAFARTALTAGHEIALHGLGHLNADQVVAEKGEAAYWEMEMKPQIDACKAAAIPVFSFAYPNCRHDARTDALFLTNGFTRLRGSIPGVPNPNPYDPAGSKLSQWQPVAAADAFFLPAADHLAETNISNIIMGDSYHTDIWDIVRSMARAGERGERLSIVSHGISPNARRISMKTEWLERMLAEADRLGVTVHGLR